jgi:hypothetical protein
MQSTTTYASKIQFRNAAKKAGVRVNNNDDYSRLALSIRCDYDVNNKTAYRTDKSVVAVGFEFYSIDAQQAMNLHAAGFELVKAIVPDVAGTKRTAYIYRLPLTK